MEAATVGMWIPSLSVLCVAEMEDAARQYGVAKFDDKVLPLFI